MFSLQKDAYMLTYHDSECSERTMLYVLDKYGAFIFRSIKKLNISNLNKVDALIWTIKAQRAFDIVFSLT